MVGERLIDARSQVARASTATCSSSRRSAEGGRADRPTRDCGVVPGQPDARAGRASSTRCGRRSRSCCTEERADAARRDYLERLQGKIARHGVARAAAREGRRRRTAGARPASAPIEIVEFSDFQCPFCLSAIPTVNQVLETYGDKIRFVYRHYPLPNHPNARPAAEASACAAEQDKFWQYHDRLFANPTQALRGRPQGARRRARSSTRRSSTPASTAASMPRTSRRTSRRRQRARRQRHAGVLHQRPRALTAHSRSRRSSAHRRRAGAKTRGSAVKFRSAFKARCGP